MKKKLALLTVLLGTKALFASTLIYQCKPIENDGDEFGSTFVVGLEKNKGRTNTMHLMSEYLGYSRGTLAAEKVKGYFRFEGFKTEFSATGKLILDVVKPMLKGSPDGDLTVTDGDALSETVKYGCTRISN